MRSQGTSMKTTSHLPPNPPRQPQYSNNQPTQPKSKLKKKKIIRRKKMQSFMLQMLKFSNGLVLAMASYFIIFLHLRFYTILKEDSYNNREDVSP